MKLPHFGKKFSNNNGIARNFFSNLLQRKVNNPSIPQGLPIFPTGDKPILYSSEAVLYYLECAPVATAIDKIAGDIASIPPLIWDTKKKEFIEQHPILHLLKNPDADVTFSEFMHAMASWYLITGNVYIVGAGYIENLPKEIRIYPSQATTIIVGIDGYAQNYNARVLGIVDMFNRTEVLNMGQVRFRYYSNEFKELYHIRTFNPQVSSNMAYGLSPLNAIYYEMKQYIEAAKYNLSVLQRQSRVSGIFKTKTQLPQEMRRRLEEQMQNMYSGSTNAGRSMIIDGTDGDFQDLLVTGRDMDYVKMREQVTKSIYKALKIPLPLVSEESMTYSNLEGAKILYYKQSVLPVRRRIDEELTKFLMPRFDNTNDDLIITYNEQDIPALEADRNEQTKLKKDSGIFTINELRKIHACDGLQNGEYIYGTMGATPIATDTNDPYFSTSLNDEENNMVDEQGNKIPKKPKEDENDTNIGHGNSEFENMVDQEPKNDDEEETDEEKKASKEKFITTLKKQVHKDGTSKFTEDEINELVEKHYGK